MPSDNSCACRKCKSCCWVSPGWFGSIEEVKGAAKIVEMPVGEFTKEFLIGEWWAGDDEDVIVPAPRKNFDRLSKERQKLETGAGDIFKDEKLRNGKGFIRASWGHNLMTGFACVFLTKDERCTIHESKPTECRKAFGCKKNTQKKATRQQVVKYWEKHQDFIDGLKRP